MLCTPDTLGTLAPTYPMSPFHTCVKLSASRTAVRVLRATTRSEGCLRAGILAGLRDYCLSSAACSDLPARELPMRMREGCWGAEG